MDKFLIDSTKIHFHPRHAADVVESDSWGRAKSVYPLYWEVTTSAACPHRCTFCSTDAIGYPAILIDAAVLIGTMREAASLGVKSVMFAGTGEPLLHKSINDIVHAAWVAKLDCAFTTNGVLLDKLDAMSLCSWVKISLNAGSRENYAAIHRTQARDWDKVWANIKDAARRKGDCALGVQCVVLPENAHEMETLAQLSRDAGADYLVLKPYSQATFSIVQRGDIDYRNMPFLAEIPQKFNTPGFEVIYRGNAMRQESEPHHYDKCRATPMTWTYTMANGDMFACSAHLLNERFRIGNINTQSFQEIWEGEGRRRCWEMMQTFDVSQCRLNCRMNGANIYYDQLANGVPHQNFI